MTFDPAAATDSEIRARISELQGVITARAIERQQETATIVDALADVAADLDSIIGPEPVAGTVGVDSLGLLLGFTATQAANNVGPGMLALAAFIRRLAICQRDVVTVLNNR